MAKHNPSQARGCKEPEPATVCLSNPHDRNGGEVHKVVGFCEYV
jgi:hypothetical protein